MLTWIPIGHRFQRWYLLDGHRRIAALGTLIAEQIDLVR